MHTTMRILSSVMCLITMIAGTVRATCVMPGPLCESYAGTPVLFYGRVVSSVLTEEQVPFTQDGKTIFLTDQKQVVNFSVIDGFEGVEGTEAVIRMSTNCDECNYPFVPGSSYLVFAEINKQTGGFTTSRCSPNHIVTSDADPDLLFLRGLKTAPLAARIFGGVYRPRGDSDRTSRNPNGIPGMSVKLEGPGGEQTKITDAAGHYEFTGLVAGQYTVTGQIPSGLVAPYDPLKVTVVERGCREVGFYAQNGTAISGAVYGPDGLPANHVHIDIIPADKAAQSSPFDLVSCCTYTDDQGHYRFPQIHPGNYIVGIHIIHPPDRAAPYPKVYSPGVEDLAAASVIRVQFGESVDDADIHIPRQLIPRTLDVYVTWPDGSPAKLALVLVQDAERHTMPETPVIGSPDEFASGASTDGSGHAVLHLLEGDDFWVDAMVNTGQTGQKCGGPARVLVAKDTEPVRLVITHGIGNCFAYLDPNFRYRP